jgi:hypothetical protein
MSLCVSLLHTHLQRLLSLLILLSTPTCDPPNVLLTLAVGGSAAREHQFRKLANEGRGDAAYNTLAYVPCCPCMPVCQPKCDSPLFVWVSAPTHRACPYHCPLPLRAHIVIVFAVATTPARVGGGSSTGFLWC